MKIPIKKTNRKVPVSSWATRIEVVTLVRNTSKGMFDPLSPLVKDISKGLENPLIAKRLYHSGEWDNMYEINNGNLTGRTPYKQAKPNDWFELQDEILFMGVPREVREEIVKDPDGYNPKKSIKRVVEQDGQIKTVEVEIDPKKSIWQRITNKIRRK